MNEVKASHFTPYGWVTSEWEIEDGKFMLKVQVPVNTTARICIPTKGGDVLLDGEAVDSQLKEKGPGYDYLLVEKGSGSYTFESQLN